MSRSLTLSFRSIRANAFIGPAAALFISANIANAANLVFNMVFARIMGPAAFADLTLLLTLKLGILSFLGALQFAFAELTAKESMVSQSRWEQSKIFGPDNVHYLRIGELHFRHLQILFTNGTLCISLSHSILFTHGDL